VFAAISALRKFCRILNELRVCMAVYVADTTLQTTVLHCRQLQISQAAKRVGGMLPRSCCPNTVAVCVLVLLQVLGVLTIELVTNGIANKCWSLPGTADEPVADEVCHNGAANGFHHAATEPKKEL
jgi:hypothetical protein